MGRQHYKIGIVVDYFSGYARELLVGVLRFATEVDRWTVLMPHLNLPGNTVLRHPTVDGILSMVGSAELAGELRKANCPIVNVSDVQMGQDFTNVVPDDDAIGRMGADYFLTHRFQHFAFASTWNSWSQFRQRAFTERLSEAGFGCETINEDADLVTRLRRLPKPLAVMAGHDARAWAVLEACRKGQLAVPDKVAILGVDDDQFIAKIARPTLSSIATAPEAVGYRAAKMLEDIIAGETPPATPLRIAPAGLVERQSTDVLAADDPLVVRALRFIRDHAQRAITVDDIANHLDVSRRLLERRFSLVLNASPLQRLQQVRLDIARRLLQTTDMPMPEVARQSGFGTATRFGVVFRRVTNSTPSAFRKPYRHRRG